MKKSALLALSFAVLFAANEPSAFKAGDLNSNNPYGLTPTEQHIYSNTQQIKQLRSRLYGLEQRVTSLEEKVDGLKSVVEGIDERLNQLKKERGSKDLEAQIAALRTDLNESVEVQKSNYAQIKKVLKEMSSLIDKISASYVTKDELEAKLSKIYALLKKENLTKKSGSQLYKEARAAYKQKRFGKAKELFLASADKKYKPATSNFYAGESCYYLKDYACAVNHYKKSASLYQNASYMPTLLLHTAISLERLGQKKEAKKFYSSVVKLYPKSKAARIAKKNLKKLK